MNDELRDHVHRLLALPPGEQLDRHTIRIFRFYERMRDDPRVGPEGIQDGSDGVACYPVILKIAHALDRNRDGKEGDAVRPAARLLGRKMGKGRYKVLYRLGMGGMGEVYAASRVRASNREDLVAVKTLKPILASGEDMDTQRIEMMVRRLNQEASNLDQVANHEHVLKFIEDGYDAGSGLIYVVTEFVDGRSLDELAFRKSQPPLPPSEVLWLIREACKGLVAIHRAPAPVTMPDAGSSYDLVVAGASGMLLHRDVKPSNILFDRGGRVKLIDLGLAGPAGATSLTGGTPGFSDPAQFTAGADLDERADVYALGKTFYALLCRDPKPPTFKLPDPTHPVWNDVPPAFVQVILRATDLDRTARYDNAEAFLAALEALGPVPPPNETSNRLRRLLAEEDREINIWVGRDLARCRDAARSWIRAAALVVLALLGAASSRLLGARPPAAPADRADGSYRPARADEHEILVRKLDVSHWVRAGSHDVRKGTVGKTSFTTRLHDAVTVAAELSEPAYCYLIAFSPDGKDRICFPEDENTPPPKTDRPGYPMSGDDGFGLDEGTGLQAFYLVASRRELPPYAEWRKGRRAPPWRLVGGPGDAVWRFDGHGTQEFTADNPFEPSTGGPARAPGRKLRKDDRVMTELNDWLREDPRIETSMAIGFTVAPP